MSEVSVPSTAPRSMAPERPEPVPQHTNSLSVAAQALASLRNALFPMIAVFFGSGSGGFGMMLAIGIGVLIFGIGIIASYLRWMRFTYTVGEQDIRVESGILARAARSVPYERIQDVALEQALIPRLLGLVEVRFETGAGGKDELKLSYLDEAEGERLRELVRARKDGVEASGDTETAEGAPAKAEEQGELLFAMGPTRLVTFGLFEFSLAVFAVLIGLTQQFDFLLPFDLWDFDAWDEQLAGPGAALAGLGPTAQIVGGIIGLAALVVVGFATGVVRTVTRDWDFRLERTAKGFRRRRGLFTRTDVVMPVHRVQALKIGTRMIRRRFGWHGLKFVSLAQDAGNASHDVAPFAQLSEIEPIVRAAGFEPPADDLDWHRASRKFRTDSALIEFAVLALIALGVAIFSPIMELALIPLGIGVLLAARQLFLWQYDRNALTARQLFVRSGWLAPRTEIADRVKLQSVEIRQGPLARARGYATLHLGLAGGSLSAEGLPAERAEELREAILSSIAGTDFSELVA
ncbi:PH domain-containing protein [Erythrobacter sp. HKB08]|uniref:PH domain-containing protein n=1 Tax=Erythrobacter sp. HKB08 TaxID=2502843 RepID=UPI001F445EDF|nr:PH domain-containing protein [Erythrobacter sp. HKB08]